MKCAAFPVKCVAPLTSLVTFASSPLRGSHFKGLALVSYLLYKPPWYSKPIMLSVGLLSSIYSPLIFGICRGFKSVTLFDQGCTPKSTFEVLSRIYPLSREYEAFSLNGLIRDLGIVAWLSGSLVFLASPEAK